MIQMSGLTRTTTALVDRRSLSFPFTYHYFIALLLLLQRPYFVFSRNSPEKHLSTLCFTSCVSLPGEVVSTRTNANDDINDVDDEYEILSPPFLLLLFCLVNLFLFDVFVVVVVTLVSSPYCGHLFHFKFFTGSFFPSVVVVIFVVYFPLSSEPCNPPKRILDLKSAVKGK